MRGSTDRQMTIRTVVDPGELIPDGHPIRRVRPSVESALARLEPTLPEMYAKWTIPLKWSKCVLQTPGIRGWRPRREFG